MDVATIAMHLGALHPVEMYALVALTLAPFVVLAVVLAVVSRRDRRRDERGTQPGQATRDERGAREPTVSATTDTAAPQSVQQ